MRELREKIKRSAVIVYLMALLPWFHFSGTELVTFTIGAVLILGIGVGSFLIVVFFLLCQFLFLKLPKRQLLKIGVGVLFTYAGLVQIPKETEETK